jgi:histidinol phosphatase-like PHP family hydrolase
MAALDNAAIAELLMQEAGTAEGHRAMAFKKAAHAAFMWPEEAVAVVKSGRSLTELHGVGRAIAWRIHQWTESMPKIDPPAERREFLTLAQARRILCKNPAWQKQLRGDLQMHTQWSDGSGTVANMAEAAIGRGYEYIAVTDHTKGLKIAGGLDEKRLAAQRQEIDAVNRDLRQRRIAFTVLRSAELNLSPSGEGDMKPAALAKLDLVVGCFHSALRRSEDQTERYLAALRNPDIQILGHPQTRVYNYRVGLQADWARVFAEAALLGKAVEIDGYADRQDLRGSLLKIARREGVRISLGTDAHHPEQLAFMELGLAAALRAKIPGDRIVSFLPVSELLNWVKEVRERAGSLRRRA